MTASRPDNEAIFHAARYILDPARRREYAPEACRGDDARIAVSRGALGGRRWPRQPAGPSVGGSISVVTIDHPTTVRTPAR